MAIYIIKGAEGAVLHPKNVGWVVRLAVTKAEVVDGSGGNEYTDGKRVVRFPTSIIAWPSDQFVAFADYRNAEFISNTPGRMVLSSHCINNNNHVNLSSLDQ